MIKPVVFLSLFFCFVTNTVLFAQARRNDNGGPKSGIFKTDVPPHLYDIIVGRPTNHSVTFSIMAGQNFSGYLNYGVSAKNLSSRSQNQTFTSGKVTFFDIVNLKPNTRYYYQLIYTSPGTESSATSDIGYFQTARPVGTDFTFDIQADSHLDENTATDIYARTLDNIAKDSSDFLIDLGDTWMTDKYRVNYKDAYKQYIAQRYYFGLAGKTTSVFLTLGNHDGESGQALRKPGPDNMCNWATQVRRQFYPNPFPNEFYSGNVIRQDGKDFIENYYAWQWGDALFIVLDPFRFTENNRNPWQRTLGADQYQWLKKTLENSKAKFKFVFMHNLVGGVDRDGIARGGVEAAKLYEWGGYDTTGIKNFAIYRPGWAMPIHDLLVANKVNVVFHGHDHFFAKQDLDDIVYQLVPQPGAMRYGNTNSAAQYGYKKGVIMNAPGYMRVHVTANMVSVEYIQTSIDAAHQNKTVLYNYQIK